MWLVDVLLHIAGGKSIFEMNPMDALLGFFVVRIGLLAWEIIFLINGYKMKWLNK